MPGNKFSSILYATTQVVKVFISCIVTLYYRRRRYEINPPWKDLNSVRKFYKILKIYLEMRICRLFCFRNDLFHVFTSALAELSRKLFTVQRPELLDRTCEAFGPACVRRMFIASPNSNLTFTDTIHSEYK
jgi:hypothetical protein